MKSITAFLILLILLPILIVVTLLIITFDGFPVLFLQTRIGLHKKPFIIYKFRTMKNEKVTFLGKILRRTGIDELPQLFNIVLGNMNFIGPRPLTQNDIERLSWDTEYHKQRWLIKPGLTGLAQLSPICNKKMSFYLDKYYAKNKSLKLDSKIIYASILTLFVGKEKAKKTLFKR